MDSPKVIAFYLPQYHPTKHNDEWWGEGFTEWTNVGKAKKLYPGHYQPKVPANLGYYDLRLSDVKEKQVELAKEAGIYGFCYYHYWFSEGHEELDLPFKQVVESNKPDFPFCLCWANESWYSKFWNKDGTTSKSLLIEQKYPGKEDNEKHFYSLLQAFKDKRYIRVHGKLLFLIYQPLQFCDFEDFKSQWNQLAHDNGLEGFYFVGQVINHELIDQVLKSGFDAVNHCHRLDYVFRYRKSLKIVDVLISRIKKLFGFPFIVPYKYAIKHAICPDDYKDIVYPTMMPNWDHTPRSADGGTVLHNATPMLFKKHAMMVLKTTIDKKGDNKMVFLKSWNEWGEGNYMEPDLRYGKGYIQALRSALRDYNTTKYMTKNQTH